MKILHITDFPLSLAPMRLVQVEKLAGMEVRMVSYSDNYGGPPFPCDLLTGDDHGTLAEVFEAADLIHFHGIWHDSHVLEALPWALEIVKRKPAIVQFHSWRTDEYEDVIRDPSVIKLVVAQYQARQFPECRPVPNAVPIHDPLHRPLNLHHDPPVIAFFPSGCVHRGWKDKGCPETLRVLETGFDYRFGTGLPWEQAMQAKQSCDIAIDEIKTGSYHMNSLESLSQGLATIAGLDAATVDALERVTGTREHPWIVATADTLATELRALVEDAAYRQTMRLRARAYMETHWNTDILARRFAAIYDEARDRFYS